MPDWSDINQLSYDLQVLYEQFWYNKLESVFFFHFRLYFSQITPDFDSQCFYEYKQELGHFLRGSLAALRYSTGTMFPYVASHRRNERSPVIGSSFMGCMGLNPSPKHFVSQCSPCRMLAMSETLYSSTMFTPHYHILSTQQPHAHREITAGKPCNPSHIFNFAEHNPPSDPQ